MDTTPPPALPIDPRDPNVQHVYRAVARYLLGTIPADEARRTIRAVLLAAMGGPRLPPLSRLTGSDAMQQAT